MSNVCGRQGCAWGSIVVMFWDAWFVCGMRRVVHITIAGNYRPTRCANKSGKHRAEIGRNDLEKVNKRSVSHWESQTLSSQARYDLVLQATICSSYKPLLQFQPVLGPQLPTTASCYLSYTIQVFSTCMLRLKTYFAKITKFEKVWSCSIMLNLNMLWRKLHSCDFAAQQLKVLTVTQTSTKRCQFGVNRFQVRHACYSKFRVWTASSAFTYLRQTTNSQHLIEPNYRSTCRSRAAILADLLTTFHVSNISIPVVCIETLLLLWQCAFRVGSTYGS